MNYWRRVRRLVGVLHGLLLAALLLGLLPFAPAVGAAGTMAATPVEALEQTLAQRPASLFPGNTLVNPEFEEREGWALLSVALFDGVVGQDAPEGGLLALARQRPTGWEAALEETDDFRNWLPEVPAELLSNQAKVLLDAQPSLQTDTQPAFSLPFPVGETWGFSGGPHGGDIRPALDFAHGNGSIRAAADGVVVRPCANMVLISHGAGWQTGYYHVRDIAVTNGQAVPRGMHLGMTSTEFNCGGGATGPHVHFWTKYNDRDYPANQIVIGGWRPENGVYNYQGCLNRGSERICSGGQLYNDGMIGDGSSFQPGQGAPDSAIAQAFADAYARVGGAAYIAEIINEVRTWGSESVVDGNNFLVQNFRETPAWNPDGDDDTGSIVYNPITGAAYVLHGHIEDRYSEIGGPRGWIGYPVEDETTLNDLSYYDFAQGLAFQRFERGFYGWRNGGTDYEGHTYYPSVAEPTINVGLLEYPFAQLDISTFFERAPGYPNVGDDSDAVAAYLVYSEAGNEYRLPMQVTDLHTAQLSIVVRVNQPIEFAIELANVGNGGGKRGSYPRSFVADGARRTVAARYLLGEPPATNGQYWNRYDGLIIERAAAYNLPAALLKAMIAHESAGLGTYNGKDPTRAYLYEPFVDREIQNKLMTFWAAPYTLPGNPAPAELRPCAATMNGGYDLPAGTTARQMVDTYYGCTNRYGTANVGLNFVAQYRIAASYGLAQMVYRWQYPRLNGAPPEAFYDANLIIDAMARKVSDDRNRIVPSLSAASTDPRAWDAILQIYNSGRTNGNPAYPGYVYNWYEGRGGAPVQPDLRLVYDGAALPQFIVNGAAPALMLQAQARTASVASLSSALALPASLGLMDELIAPVDGSESERLLRLTQIAGSSPPAAQITIFTTTDSSSAVRWQSSPLEGLDGVASLSVRSIAGFTSPVIIAEIPVGFHSQLLRLFIIEANTLREISPLDASGNLGIFSDVGPVEILDDGTIIASVGGATPGATTSTVYTPAPSGYTAGVVVSADPTTDTNAPTPLISPARAYDANDWYNQPISVTLSAVESDLRSLSVSVTPLGETTPSYQFTGRTIDPLSFSVDGSSLITLTATDFAGNSASASYTVQLDQQAPTIEVIASPGGPLMQFADIGAGLALSECSSDGLIWSSCATLASITAQSFVRLSDLADNTIETRVQGRRPTLQSWRLDKNRARTASLSLANAQVRSEAGICSPDRAVPVKSGEHYMIGVKVLEADSTMVPWLKAVWLRDGRVIHSEVLSQTAGFSGLLSGEVVAPRGATSLKVELRGSGIGTTIFDDASIRDAGGNELLTSGGFEGDMDGWRTWRWRGNLGLVTIVQRADESGKALRVAAQPTWNGAESLSLFNQQGRASALAVAKQRAVDYFAVVSGQSYTLNLSTRLVGVEQEALVQVRFYDAQGQGVGTAISSALLQGDAEWQWLSLAGEAPEGAVTAQVVVKLTGRGHVLTDMAVLIGK